MVSCLPDRTWDEPRAGEDLDSVLRPASVVVEKLPQPFQVFSIVTASDMLFNSFGRKGWGFMRVSGVCPVVCQFQRFRDGE
jgi:hypothetical protein